MRNFLLLLALLHSVASAAELDAKLLRLIGDDAVAAYGVDLDRYADSTLAHFFPVPMPDSFIANVPRQFVRVKYQGSIRESSNLTIYLGPTSALDIGRIRARLLGSDGLPDLSLVVLDSQTAIFGNANVIAAARARWSASTPLGSAPAEIGKLSQAYDLWFFVLQPLHEIQEAPGIDSKEQMEFANLIQELKVGARVGGVNQVYVAARTNGFEDAQTLAGLAKWLPGMLRSSSAEESRIARMIENIDARAFGSEASMSFTISDQKLQALIDEEARQAKSVPGDER